MVLRTSTSRRPALAATLAATGAVALLAAPAAAHAAPGELTVTYDAVGTSHIAKNNTDLPLGPTSLTTTVQPDGTVTGSLALPPQTTTFTVLGFVPVSATAAFLPVGGTRQVTGTLTAGKVRTKAKFVVKLSDVRVAGLPIGVGNSCQSATTAVIPAITPKGEKFSITTGGNLAGTFTLPPFANCGLTTPILNLLVPGDGNTATITVSNGRIGT